MINFRKANIVLNELKKNGFEAYIVGGSVRDHLLNMETQDIDITTNAKPYEVSKIFKKTKPTGIKYGTVSVFIGEEVFEVTTYRTESDYSDLRHPENVVFSTSVEEDVVRRDFTINGLLMDQYGKITDFVNGQEDLKQQMIKTINDPHQRFNEDALRMMRAFYFQSKLGFQIHSETRKAITDLKENLLKISSERVLMEMIKILKGTHSKLAIHSMVSTKAHEVLPGLEKGLIYINQMQEIPFVDAFFTLCFTMHEDVPSYWPFSNKHRYKYVTAANLANQKTRFDYLTLYTYGLELCLLANKVNYMLKRGTNDRNTIEKRFNELPLKSDLDLALRPHEMIKIAEKKQGAWVSQAQQAMILNILEGKLKNHKVELEAFLKEFIRGV